MLDIRDHGGLFGGINLIKYKRYATGTAVSGNTMKTKIGVDEYTSNTSTGAYDLTVTGLGFTPSIIICYKGAYDTCFYVASMGWQITFNSPSTDGVILMSSDQGSITSNGFTLPVASRASTYVWKAFE